MGVSVNDFNMLPPTHRIMSGARLLLWQGECPMRSRGWQARCPVLDPNAQEMNGDSAGVPKRDSGHEIEHQPASGQVWQGEKPLQQ
jgi:hypothetical protein